MFDRLSTALADRYRIERELGAGGMATVYLAHDIKHDRKVAVKVLDADLAESLGRQRFVREIALAARLGLTRTAGGSEHARPPVRARGVARTAW